MRDMPGDPQEDIQKVARVARGDRRSWTLPAILELVLTTITGLAALLWVVALFLWVPEPVSGPVWIGGGMLGMILLGGPTGLVYMLRRGGIEVLSQLIREVTR